MARRAPLVGIGMTLHNRAAYLSEAVESLLSQSFGDFTLALVDDGSIDESETLGRRFSERDARVRYIRLPRRQGMVAAWREAFPILPGPAITIDGTRDGSRRWLPRWIAIPKWCWRTR
jgi:glycosyltransferase involved in cell wall biosynthesis